jgi:hypothetical protein
MSMPGETYGPTNLQGFVPLLYCVAAGSYAANINTSQLYGAYAADTTAASVSPVLSTLELPTGVSTVGTSSLISFTSCEWYVTGNSATFDLSITLNRQTGLSILGNFTGAELRIRNQIISETTSSGTFNVGVNALPVPASYRWNPMFKVEFLNGSGQVLLGPIPQNSSFTVNAFDHFARLLNDQTLALLVADYASASGTTNGAPNALRPMTISDLQTLFSGTAGASTGVANDVVRISMSGGYRQ